MTNACNDVGAIALKMSVDKSELLKSCADFGENENHTSKWEEFPLGLQQDKLFS